MRKYKGDLHIHSVLSPCGDIEMSPKAIVKAAVEKKLDFIGITDHNSTLQAKIVRDIGIDYNLKVFTGIEVTTKEEVHSICFLPNDQKLDDFQRFVELHQPRITNDPDIFGFQLCVNENNDIIKEIEYYLGVSLNLPIDELEKRIHELQGIFIPAHINRSRHSIFSQLGFFPDDLAVDALEIFNRTDINDFKNQHPELMKFNLIKNSDAHFVHQIGSFTTDYYMEELTFDELKLSVQMKNGRYTQTQ